MEAGMVELEEEAEDYLEEEDVRMSICDAEEDEVDEEEAGDEVDEEEDGGDADTPDALQQAAKKLKLTSPVWYTAATKLDSGEALCQVCNKVFSAKDSSPSNITKHVRTRHSGSEECKNMMALEAKQKVDKAKKNIPKPKLTMADFFHGKKMISKKETQKIMNSLEDFIVGTNTSLSMVENPFFRKLVFDLNSGFVMPTRTTITDHIDKKIKDVKKELAKEIAEDIKEHKTISTTTDGGPSHDINKTKKNTVTVSRIDSKWIMKTDTLALRVAEGAQSAEVLRTVVRDVLDEFGRKEDWDVNMTTDNASAPRSARASGRHDAVGLPIKYDSPCVDHQFHLLLEESIKTLPLLLEALARVRAFVTFLNQSSLARRELILIQRERGVARPLCPMMGTLNRWFHKAREAGRLFELRDTVEEYDTRHEDDDRAVSDLQDHHWTVIGAYLKVVQPFEKASAKLGGDKYPAACMVIAMLDQLYHDLEDLPGKMVEEEMRLQRRGRGSLGGVDLWREGGEGRKFVSNMLLNFVKRERFPEGFKTKAPYNALCLLDPNNSDIFFDSDEQIEEAINVIKRDRVYAKMRAELTVPVDNMDMEDENQNQNERGENVMDRRAELLARKRSREEDVVRREQGGPGTDVVGAMIEEEITRWRRVTPFENKVVPLEHWKKNHKEFPTIAVFMKANAAFQPTSVSSERLFNKDKQLFRMDRKSFEENRAEGFVFLQDYLSRRIARDKYVVCKSCPQPPHEEARYRLTCVQHNQ